MYARLGKYRSVSEMAASVEASGAEIVTVAVRRLETSSAGMLAGAIDWEKVWLLPNTAGCATAEDAVRVARLGRELARSLGQTDNNFVKLEVINDAQFLLPDPIGTLAAARQHPFRRLIPRRTRACASLLRRRGAALSGRSPLCCDLSFCCLNKPNRLVSEGFAVLPYCSADPVLCRHLEDIGCATVMPLGSPIGQRKRRFHQKRTTDTEEKRERERASPSLSTTCALSNGRHFPNGLSQARGRASTRRARSASSCSRPRCPSS